MLNTTTFVGLDVHARSIKAVSLDVMTGEVRCATFGYDAEFLARMLSVGNVVEVWVPDDECEAARDLTRALEDARDDLSRAKQRLSKFLLRHGLAFDERTPTGRRKGNWMAEGPRQGPGPGPGRPQACRQGRAEAGREAGGAARARGPQQQGERGHGARARLLGVGGRPHGRGGVGGRSPAHKPITPEAVGSEAVEANLRSLFCERPGRHTRAQTVGSTKKPQP